MGNRIKLSLLRLSDKSRAASRVFLPSAFARFEPDLESATNLDITKRVNDFLEAASVPLRSTPIECVEQMLHLEQSVFQQLDMTEFFNKAWQSPDKATAAPHITALTRSFNHFSYWIRAYVSAHFFSFSIYFILILLLSNTHRLSPRILPPPTSTPRARLPRATQACASLCAPCMTAF